MLYECPAAPVQTCLFSEYQDNHNIPFPSTWSTWWEIQVLCSSLSLQRCFWSPWSPARPDTSPSFSFSCAEIWAEIGRFVPRLGQFQGWRRWSEPSCAPHPGCSARVPGSSTTSAGGLSSQTPINVLRLFTNLDPDHRTEVVLCNLIRTTLQKLRFHYWHVFLPNSQKAPYMSSCHLGNVQKRNTKRL